MATGVFDPSTFLDMSMTEANSTVRVPVPESEYPAVVKKVDIRSWTSKDQTQSGIALDLLWSIQDDGVKTLLEQQEVVVKQGIMLDTNASGGIDTGKGKNVNLGKLRESLGLNDPGKPFSFRMLEGQMAKVSVKHRLVEGEIFSEVKAVTKLS